MQKLLSIFFLLGMLSMTFVAPNILTDINFAEVVEDETHPTHKMKEVFPDKPLQFSHESSFFALNNLSDQEYLCYRSIYESTHIIEYHCPPPNH